MAPTEYMEEYNSQLKQFCTATKVKSDGSKLIKARRLEGLRLMQRVIVKKTGDPDALEKFDALPWDGQLFFHSLEKLNDMADEQQIKLDTKSRKQMKVVLERITGRLLPTRKGDDQVEDD